MKKDFDVTISFTVKAVDITEEEYQAAVVRRLGRPVQKLVERYGAVVVVDPAERIERKK